MPAWRSVGNAPRTCSGSRAARARRARAAPNDCAPSDTRVTPRVDAAPGELVVDRLGVGLDRHLGGRRQAREQARSSCGAEQRRRPAAEEHGVERRRGHVPRSSAQLREQRVDVRGVPALAAGDGDEVAVPAAVRAERDVDVEVADAAHSCIVAPLLTRKVPSRRPSGGPQA